MNALRKIAVGSLAAVLACSMAACGSGNANSTGTGESTGKAVTVNEKSAKATSLADFGTMEDLEKAAKEEGALNVIALPHDWSNYGDVISGFKKKYPKIKINEQNPNASSKEEVDAGKTNKGTDAAPDVYDLGLAVASTSTDNFASYKVQAWDKIPDSVKDKDGKYYADYTGIMSIGWNADKYGDIKSINDLTDPKFAGTVALNGKPAEAGAAFNGYLMINQLAGGDIKNLQPGLDFFKKLKDCGNLTTVDVTDGTIDSGQTGVVMDWTYNQASYQKSLKAKGVNWKFKTFKNAQVVSYYNQAINVDAPHPAAARLWEEYLYTADAQNEWFKGGANPVLLDSMKEDGTVDQNTLKTAITIEGDDRVVGMICMEPESANDILVLSENGYGKRTDLDAYRTTNRGGKGVKTMQVTEKTGKVVSIQSVSDEYDLMIITRNGTAIRTAASDIRLAGRLPRG